MFVANLWNVIEKAVACLRLIPNVFSGRFFSTDNVHFSNHNSQVHMSQDVPLRDLWQQMIEKGDFSRVGEYDKSAILQNIEEDDRHLLALLMALHGEKLILEDYASGVYYLERATEISPDKLPIWMTKGRAYGQISDNKLSLEASCAAYARAAQLDPNMAAVWHYWAIAAMQLGNLENEVALLYDADVLFEKAEFLSRGEKGGFPSLLWFRGRLWHTIGRLSGEPCDLGKALAFYQQMAATEPKAAEFWNDYANAVSEIGGLLKKPELFSEVVSLYRKAIELNPRHFRSQFNLGLCLQHFFQVLPKHSLFWGAHEQYSQCRLLNPQHGPLYRVWGKLLLLQGIIKRDSELLGQACETLERAVQLGEAEQQLDLDLAEAYLALGGVREELASLRQAEERLRTLLSEDPNCVDAWASLGYCHIEYGHYFNEVGYYRLALDHFAQALALDHTHAHAWYGRASASLALSEYDQTEVLAKASLSFFEQAAEFEMPSLPYVWNEWGLAAMRVAEIVGEPAAVEMAVSKFESAIELDLLLSEGEYLDPEPLYNYGCAYDLLGDLTEDSHHYERSIALLQKVLEIDPEHLLARYNLAVAFSHFGEVASDVEALKLACHHFQAVLAQDSEDEMAWNEWALALINLGLLLHEEAQPDLSEHYFTDAEEKLQYAVALGYEVAFYNLACLYSLRGEYAIAIAHLERAERAEALPPLEDVLQDVWLDGLRQTDQFQRLLTQLLSKQHPRER